MLRSLTVVFVASLSVALLWPASDASAVKLRRPYDANVALGYGFDNNYGSGGCTDYNCGGTCYDGHGGSDFPLVVGSTVRAGAAGRVVATYNGCANYGYVGNTCGGRCGNYVKIEHSDGQFTLYCHMKKDSIRVSTGQTVDCGANIGQTASSGSSSGPHLHMSWRTSSNTDRDTYAGSCTSSPGAWRQQNAYGAPVGTSCGCTPSAEVCDGRDNDCDGGVDEEDVCENDYLVQTSASYAAPQTTDINGDGLQDACGRFPEGWGCFLATGSGWGERIQGDFMRDDGGWGSPHYFATIRTGDLDADGLADVCARHSTNGYQCWRSTGDGFEHYADADGYTNDAGWTDPAYYTTFRLADIDGDGRDDVCARGPAGWSCRLSTGSGFGASVDGPNWSDESGFARAMYYGTIRTGDVDADGREDVCIRRAAGFDCFKSTGDGFERFGLIEDFSNEGGWDDMTYWATLRLADYDGDGRDDVCARYYSGWRCLRATDAGFAAMQDIKAMSVASGWDDPTNYATYRVGDVNGDGADDFCARANARMICYGLEAGQPFSVDGPEWSDDVGWAAPEYYQTITLSDIDSDRRRDICARAARGLTCRRRTDDGFEAIDWLEDFGNANNWNQLKYYSTLRLGSGECLAEVCNGFDDNCDGQIDEENVCDQGSSDTGVTDAGSTDTGLPSNDAGAGDSGTIGHDTFGSDAGGDIGGTQNQSSGGRNSYGGEAACAVGSGADSERPVSLVALMLSALALLWRRRRVKPCSPKALLVAGLVGAIFAAGCENSQAPSPEKASEPSADETRRTESALESSEISSERRLLAVYDDWQLWGVLQPVPPRSDATPRYDVELVRDGSAVSSPIDDEFVTNAVFVPGTPPTLAARLSDARLVLVDLDRQTVSEVDDNVGFSVAAAQSGCCVTYMRGEMGFQSTLRVYDIESASGVDLSIEDNGWSPAVSPEGNQVVFVAPARDGTTEMYVHDFSSGETRPIGLSETGLAPSGPQPPFWTERGIAFAAEGGAYLIGLDGRVRASAAGADGLLVDLSSGRFFDTSGAPVELDAAAGAPADR